ncbi:MAG: DUF5110 domain-containing protein [Nostoc sp.]|uniref:DUF5110 domain-containing protein n=1 Tax=Nostoc sp. TaxID=1180 RepID=UPI002FFB46E9
MPLYVRSGAIAPMQPVRQYVIRAPLNKIRLRIWSSNNEYQLFEDDGQTKKYQDKNFSLTNTRVFTETNQTVVEIGARVGKCTPAPREAIVELVDVGEQRFQDDDKRHTLQF